MVIITLCLVCCWGAIIPTNLICQIPTDYTTQAVEENVVSNGFSDVFSKMQFERMAVNSVIELHQADTNKSSVLFDSTTSSPAKDSSYRYTMNKSPSGAIYRSLVLPGWGQFYNESYIKAGLFAAGAVTLISIIAWNHSKFIESSNKYDNLQPTDALYNITYREREFYRDQRDVTGLWYLGIYALAAIDAYVGAHLYDFDVSDKGVAILPVVQPTGMYALSVQYTF